MLYGRLPTCNRDSFICEAAWPSTQTLAWEPLERQLALAQREIRAKNHTSRVSFTHEKKSSGWIGLETPKNALGIRDANFLFSLWWVRHKPYRRGLLHPTLCLENSPRILKVPSTLNSGFFLFTPLIMNSLGLQKGEQNQHRFFSDILWWNYWLKESSWKLIEFFFTQKWASKLVFCS